MHTLELIHQAFHCQEQEHLVTVTPSLSRLTETRIPQVQGQDAAARLRFVQRRSFPDQSIRAKLAPQAQHAVPWGHGPIRGLPVEWPTATPLTTPPGGPLTMGQPAEPKHTSKTSRRTQNKSDFALSLVMSPTCSLLFSCPDFPGSGDGRGEKKNAAEPRFRLK